MKKRMRWAVVNAAGTEIAPRAPTKGTARWYCVRCRPESRARIVRREPTDGR